MNRENENLSESRPEISAVEAALAQLRPRREARFADEVKSRMKDALSDKTPASENVTATVKIPLTHYIRIAQFNAAAGGLLAGLFLGVLLGGSGVFFVLSRFETRTNAAGAGVLCRTLPYVRSCWRTMRRSLPLERALLDQLDKEPVMAENKPDPNLGKERSNADRS